MTDTKPSIAAEAQSDSVADDPSPHHTEFEQAVLAILRALEASLLASQKALLTRDLAGIEDGTQQQMRLAQSLAILGAVPAHLLPTKSSSGDMNPPVRRVPFSPNLASAAHRVWHLARVQRALLARAQQSVRMLASLLAGPSVGYGPPQCSGTISAIPAARLQPKPDSLCQV